MKDTRSSPSLIIVYAPTTAPPHPCVAQRLSAIVHAPWQANIRGGGEFGPKWHQAALKANRNKAYEDFEAVAKDEEGGGQPNVFSE